MTPDKAKQFIEDNKINFVLAQFVDIHGAAKTKLVPASCLMDVVEQGAGFAAQDFDNQFNRLGTVANRGMVAGQTMTSADLGVSDTALNLNKTNEAAAAQAAADAAAS